MRAVVTLGRLEASGGFQPIGAGILLDAGDIAWLLAPRLLIASPSGDAAAALGDLVAVMLTADDEQIGVRLADLMDASVVRWVQGAPENPYALCPMALPASLGIRGLPAHVWRPGTAVVIGSRCQTIHVASGLPSHFGPLLLEGVVCAVSRERGRDVLTTIPSLPGGMGAPIFMQDAEDHAPSANEESAWRFIGCLTRRIRIPGGRRQLAWGRGDIVEHLSVIAAVDHALPLFDAALRRAQSGFA